MNERIKELAKQCYETGPLGKDGWPEYTKFNEVKFAELIVRECLAQGDKVDVMLEEDKEKTGVAWVGYAIEKNFGVEE
jgi:hypothetical protein